MLAAFQGCGVRGFWVESDFISDSTTDIQLDHFYITLLNWSITLLKVVIPVEMLQFLLKLLLKQRFLAVYYDFHRFNSPFVRVGNFGKVEVGSRKFGKSESDILPPTPQPCCFLLKSRCSLSKLENHATPACSLFALRINGYYYTLLVGILV